MDNGHADYNSFVDFKSSLKMKALPQKFKDFDFALASSFLRYFQMDKTGVFCISITFGSHRNRSKMSKLHKMCKNNMP